MASLNHTSIESKTPYYARPVIVQCHLDSTLYFCQSPSAECDPLITHIWCKWDGLASLSLVLKFARKSFTNGRYTRWHASTSFSQRVPLSSVTCHRKIQKIFQKLPTFLGQSFHWLTMHFQWSWLFGLRNCRMLPFYTQGWGTEELAVNFLFSFSTTKGVLCFNVNNHFKKQ